MPTYNQLLKGSRKKKVRYNVSPALEGRPQKKAVCMKIYITKPKKPNSAQRKVTKVRITSTRKQVIVYIPGQGHNLQKHSVVMVRGGRVRDLPGVHYHLIRGKYDFIAKENFERRNRRSKYGHKNPDKIN